MKPVLAVSAFGILAVSGCTEVSTRDARIAEEECRVEARHDGYDQVAVTSGPLGFGDEVSLSMSARRHGNDYTGTCAYDLHGGRAQVSLDKSDDDGDEFDYARQVCSEEADDRGYKVNGASNERVRNHVIRMNMDLHRHGDDYVGYCRFEDGHADLDIDRD